MSVTYHRHSKCDQCQADSFTFADVAPKAWLTLNGDGIGRPICLCPRCGNNLLERCGIERSPSAPAEATARE